MRLIAMSLYAKLEKQVKSLDYYRSTITGLFREALGHVTEWESPIFFPKDQRDKNPLIIIIASSKGLCGSYNALLFKQFKKDYETGSHQKPTFITIGRKATKFVKAEGLGNIALSFNDFKTSNFTTVADKLIKEITEGKNPYSSVTCYSNFFKNFFVQVPRKTKLTPFDPEAYEALADKSKEPKEKPKPVNGELIWEHSREDILQFLSIRYLRSVLLHILFQSLIAEQSARFLAMDNATTNADKILDNLTLQYNKSRQALITKELSELTACVG